MDFPVLWETAKAKIIVYICPGSFQRYLEGIGAPETVNIFIFRGANEVISKNNRCGANPASGFVLPYLFSGGQIDTVIVSVKSTKIDDITRNNRRCTGHTPGAEIP
jgi:hypothetical protein